MKYQLFFPTLDARGSTMLDYIMGERPESRTYELVYEGEVTCNDGGACDGSCTQDALGFLWQRHNIGDDCDGNRPRATEIRSMCIGDVIAFTDRGAMWVVEPVGWREIDVMHLARVVPLPTEG